MLSCVILKLRMIMKIFLILLLLNLSVNVMAEDDCDNCKIDLSNIRVKKPIANEEIEAILENTLKKVRKYKKEKNSEIYKINNKLENIIKEFASYRIKKNQEIRKIKRELALTKEKLYKSQKKLARIKKESKKVVKLKEITIPNPTSVPQIITPSIPISGEDISLPTQNVSSWVELVVEDGVDIYQLALRYYGDRAEYKQIYLANKDVIGENLQIVDGMSLRIPISEVFEEQPMILNRE